MKIGVIGAGTMGSGIAQVAAMQGFDVILSDVAGEMLTRAQVAIAQDLQRGVDKGKIAKQQADQALTRVHTSTDLEQMRSATVVIEAIVERSDIKHQLFGKLDSICSPETIFASNTSSLSITELASATRIPERFIGIHFFNPAPRMKLIEIIRGHLTSDEVVERTELFVRQLGKEPVIAKDSPGFIVNRVARNFYGEAFRIVDEGVGSFAQVDAIMRAGGFPMGPFELMDLIGIDINLAVTESVYEQFFHEARFKPHLIQKKMVEARLLGRKTKRGFYDYTV
jgi:3-hydroxybutyryl-CoA dehydrogenase